MSENNFDEVIDFDEKFITEDTSIDNLQIGLPSFEQKTNNIKNKKPSLIDIEDIKARMALRKELEDYA